MPKVYFLYNQSDLVFPNLVVLFGTKIDDDDDKCDQICWTFANSGNILEFILCLWQF